MYGYRYTDDPAGDEEFRQSQMRPYEVVYPTCEYCKEPITDEELIDLDFYQVHIDCMMQANKSKTKHFIQYR